ncbi:MAG TPA: tyrosinase family protein [Lysobacter sp.]|nr:tyrosinase family protein [Lysobacter sp.]
MHRITRRDFMKGLAALPVAFALPDARAQTTPLVRYDCASAKGREMLAIYAQAVQQMEAMGPDNPMSWMWQWYTHFVNGTTTKSAELTRIFGEADSPPKSLANETWNTCQSHAGQNSNHFLPWHRMFVYYFERIVRQVTGRADFTLPYWDYTSSDPAKRGVVPVEFRMPDDPTFFCLHRAARTTLANTGEPIHKNQPTDVMDISDAMAKTHYSTVDSVMGFCRAIDSGIHGRIHVLVGNSRNMGAVPYAASDPLFWVHHASIDRMWASWNRNGGKNPTAPWIETRFVMVDANGARVERPLKSFFSILTLGYTYDSFIPRPSAKATTIGSVAEAAARARGALTLGARPARTVLEPLPGEPRSSVLGLDDAQPNKRVHLVLRNLHTWKQPAVLFHVYLGPRSASGRLDPAEYAGNIHFFDAEFHDHGDAQLDTALGENFYSFDVTGVLHSLRRRGVEGVRTALPVTIVPAGTPVAGGEPMVGTIELVRQ